MRLIKFAVILAFAFALNNSTFAASSSIKKVLPQLIDTAGRTSLLPSLYERDAYQHFLRTHSDQCDGLRFAVLWNAPRGQPLVLRIELRGSNSTELNSTTIEISVKKTGWFSHWSFLDLRGADYKKIGNLVGWRATLWDGTKLVAEQKSFLW